MEDEGYEVADFPGCYREQEGEGKQDAADAEVEEKRWGMELLLYLSDEVRSKTLKRYRDCEQDYGQ